VSKPEVGCAFWKLIFQLLLAVLMDRIVSELSAFIQLTDYPNPSPKNSDSHPTRVGVHTYFRRYAPEEVHTSDDIEVTTLET